MSYRSLAFKVFLTAMVASYLVVAGENIMIDKRFLVPKDAWGDYAVNYWQGVLGREILLPQKIVNVRELLRFVTAKYEIPSLVVGEIASEMNFPGGKMTVREFFALVQDSKSCSISFSVDGSKIEIRASGSTK